ncbi:Nif11-like leader peptide family natural product precursor [Kamptonema formosum]|uniref:Nif11-like leader peptide family natural product precursor n=1 Tax=Kamptonema formosum TaxID=331992 RepID=UPI00034D01CA|nr:Nif11-like leader peptide family natural product precursor [Oscillatoria sp. PCC 10802]
MSRESVTQFLADVARDPNIREKFQAAANSRDFIAIAQELGYGFTEDEMEEVVKEYSQGVTVRRKTGVWKWLRTVHWRKPRFIESPAH